VNAVELIGRPVLDLATATTVGRVGDVVVDATGRHTLGVRLAKAKTPGDWLAWERIAAVGPDAVTIEATDRVVEASADPVARALRGDHALGRRVLTDQGRQLGELDDVVITDDGAVEALVVAGVSVPADAVLGIGSFATVVRDPNGA
jgi:uncharacterized protein YrrD